MRTTLLLLVLILTICVGCAATHTTTAQRLIPLQSESSYHPLFYVGSDTRYHYFSYLNVKYWQQYRVPCSELTLAQTFPHDGNRSEVLLPGTLEKALTK